MSEDFDPQTHAPVDKEDALQWWRVWGQIWHPDDDPSDIPHLSHLAPAWRSAWHFVEPWGEEVQSYFSKKNTIENLVRMWEDSDRIPLNFDDWETVVLEEGRLEHWVKFNIEEYLGYVLRYQRGQANDQGAHGDPWLDAGEIKILESILATVRGVMNE